MLYQPIKTGARLRRLCDPLGLNANFNRTLGAWEITTNPDHGRWDGEQVGDWSTEYLLPEQLANLLGKDIVLNYHPKASS